MNKTETYKQQLIQSEDWISFLYDHSNLPGPRANLELLWAVADLGDESFFNRCLEYDAHKAPTNTPGEFVAACGAAGLGKLISEGKPQYYKTLREFACDKRWRVREGVAMALQHIGKKDFNGLVSELNNWKLGNPYEQRAVVAGLCEPDLLTKEENAAGVLDIIFEIAASVARIPERSTESFKALRKGLGYGLSVAIVAFPERGKDLFEKLLFDQDRDIRWVLKENLKKKRLIRMDREWVARMLSSLK